MLKTNRKVVENPTTKTNNNFPILLQVSLSRNRSSNKRSVERRLEIFQFIPWFGLKQTYDFHNFQIKRKKTEKEENLFEKLAGKTFIEFLNVKIKRGLEKLKFPFHLFVRNFDCSQTCSAIPIDYVKWKNIFHFQKTFLDFPVKINWWKSN